MTNDRDGLNIILRRYVEESLLNITARDNPNLFDYKYFMREAMSGIISWHNKEKKKYALGLLPEKRPFEKPYQEEDFENYGFNHCIDEITKKIEEEQ